MSTNPAPHLDLDWTFGDRIRKIRRSLGITQQQLAEAIGKGDRSVAAWESGTNTPRDIVSIAKRIELAYDVPAAWTLGIQGNEKDPRPEGPRGETGGGAMDYRRISRFHPHSLLHMQSRQSVRSDLASAA